MWWKYLLIFLVIDGRRSTATELEKKDGSDPLNSLSHDINKLEPVHGLPSIQTTTKLMEFISKVLPFTLTLENHNQLRGDLKNFKEKHKLFRRVLKNYKRSKSLQLLFSEDLNGVLREFNLLKDKRKNKIGVRSHLPGKSKYLPRARMDKFDTTDPLKEKAKIGSRTLNNHNNEDIVFQTLPGYDSANSKPSLPIYVPIIINMTQPLPNVKVETKIRNKLHYSETEERGKPKLKAEDMEEYAKSNAEDEDYSNQERDPDYGYMYDD